MKKIRILCVSIIILGIGLFVFAAYVIPITSSVSHWCIGLASSMLVLGLGYLINTLFVISDSREGKNRKSLQWDESKIGVKEKAGYLVCKIMSILLCIYLFLLNMLHADRIILLLSIILVIVQYALDLSLQIYYANHRDK